MSEERTTPVQMETTEEETSEVVHGVAGSIVGAATPRAKRIRPVAGVVLLVLVALASIYMQHEMKERQQKLTARAQAPKAGQGPAAQLERAMLDDQAKHGLDTGQSHLASGLSPRPSLTEGAPAPDEGSPAIPRLEYRESVNASGQLSAADARRLHEYQLEQEAIEAGTAAGGRGSVNFSSPNPNNGSGQDDLARARADEANLRAQIEKIGSGTGGEGAANLLGAIRSALGAGTSPPAATAGNGPIALPVNAQTSEYENQNNQTEKQQFLDRTSVPASNYLPYSRTPAISKYEIKQGWLIPAVLEEELDSDLPGMIRALVRENVYDSVTGKYLLIPQGTRIIGVYNSNIGFGQGAVQTVWRRILFPDGSSLDLGGFEGNDSQGGSGLRDQVDNHWKRVLSGALLTSLFAAGLQISQGQNSSVLGAQSFGQQLGAAVGTQVGELGQQVTRRNLNIQPTIQIRPGYRFFIRVEKDLRFQAPYAPSPASQ